MAGVCEDKVLTGAIAVIKSGGFIIGKMKGVNYQEQLRRAEVVGLGSLLPSELPVVAWSANLTCEFMLLKASQGLSSTAINRSFKAVRSLAQVGLPSYEDNLVLECCKKPVSIEVFKKICDQYIDGKVVPKYELLFTISEVYIESDSLGVQEGGIGSKNQSYKCLTPALEA